MTSESNAEVADPRILHTRRAFKQALLDAASPQWDWKVSVSELCKKAGVSRPTFYQHFTTVDDVYAELLHDRLVDIAHLEMWHKGAGVPRDSELVSFFEDLREVPGFYEPILGGDEVFGKARRAFVHWMAQRIAESVFDTAYEDLDAEARQRALFIAGGIVVTMGHWIYSTDPCTRVSAVEISRQVNSYIAALSVRFEPATGGAGPEGVA